MTFIELKKMFSSDSQLWSRDLNELGFFKRKILSWVRCVRVVVQGCVRDRCALRASSLTYYTLMSLVPVLALGLSLSKAFGVDGIIRERIMEKISLLGTGVAKGTEEAVVASDVVSNLQMYATQIFEQIDKINFTTLGSVGLIALIWTALTMLAQVEMSFNTIWHAKERSILRKASDYIAIIVILPLLVVAASTAPVVAKFEMLVMGSVPNEAYAHGIVSFLMVFVPTTLAFAVAYTFVPNTKVKFRAAIGSGVVTALAFLIWLKICTALQGGAVRYSKLYGGLATLPILLAWAYFSWHIILFGAELTFGIQNASTYFRDEDAKDADAVSRARLAFAVVYEMGTLMRSGTGETFSAEDFAKMSNVSMYLITDTMQYLIDAKIVSEASQGGYVLLKSPEAILVSDIFCAVLCTDKINLDKAQINVRDSLQTMENEVLAILSKPILPNVKG